MTQRAAMARRWALGLLVLAALGTILLFVSTQPQDPCRDPALQAALLDLPASRRVRREPAEEVHGEIFRKTGDLAADPDHTAFGVLRSFDVASAASSGQLLRMPMDPHRSWREVVEVDGERVTLHWSEEVRSKSVHQVGRVLFLGRRSVDALLRVQLASALDPSRSGPEPLSVYLVEVIAGKSGLEPRIARAKEWLVAGARQFRASCGPP